MVARWARRVDQQYFRQKYFVDNIFAIIIFRRNIFVWKLSSNIFARNILSKYFHPKIFIKIFSSENYCRNIFIWNISSKYFRQKMFVEYFVWNIMSKYFHLTIFVKYFRLKYFVFFVWNILSKYVRLFFSSTIFRKYFSKKVENIDILKFITDIENVDPESRNWFLCCFGLRKKKKNYVVRKMFDIFSEDLRGWIEREGLSDRHS